MATLNNHRCLLGRREFLRVLVSWCSTSKSIPFESTLFIAIHGVCVHQWDTCVAPEIATSTESMSNCTAIEENCVMSEVGSKSDFLTNDVILFTVRV